jgi:hypothetical protein
MNREIAPLRALAVGGISLPTSFLFAPAAARRMVLVR